MFEFRESFWFCAHPTHWLKITENVVFNFFILAFFTHFSTIKIDLSGNTVWTQASDFQKLAKIDDFGHFYWTFVNSKCKRSSLRSQCWVRLFLWFSNTLFVAFFKWVFFYKSGSCTSHVPDLYLEVYLSPTHLKSAFKCIFKIQAP